MKILYLHPTCSNIGDTLVEAGAKYLIHEAIGWHHFHQARLEAVPLDGIMYYDAVVLIGTPWFWSACKCTEKYGWLHQIASLSCTKRLAVGIGSSFELNLDWKEETEVDRVWSRFSYVSTRDWITHALLPKSEARACPSLFSAEAFGVVPTRPFLKQAIVYASLDCRSLTAYFLSKDVKQQIQEAQDKLIRDNVDVITMNCWDQAAFEQAYPGREGIHVTDPERLLTVLNNYAEISSIRVHACAAALSLGRAAKIWPIDTRAFTVMACGAESLLSAPKVEPINASKSDYIEALRNALT